MYKEVLANANMTWWALSSLILFVTFFVGVLVWIFRKGSQEQYQRIALLPLDSQEAVYTKLHLKSDNLVLE